MKQQVNRGTFLKAVNDDERKKIRKKEPTSRIIIWERDMLKEEEKNGNHKLL